MTQDKFEQLKNILDDCHTLFSFVEMVEGMEQDSDESILDDRLKTINEQCERVQLHIDKFRRTL